MSYMGALFTTKACTCKVKDKSNWVRISPISNTKYPSCILKCNKCMNQWESKARYIKEIKKSDLML